MNTHEEKTQENKRQAVANGVFQKQSMSASTFQFVDNRPEAIVQSRLKAIANNSPLSKQVAQLQMMAGRTLAGQALFIQCKENVEGNVSSVNQLQLDKEVSSHAAPLQLAKGKKKKANKKLAAKTKAAKAKDAKKKQDSEEYELASAGKLRDVNRINAKRDREALEKARQNSKINKRKDHILNRHRHGAGKGKTEFPRHWNDDKIITEILRVIVDTTNIITEDEKYGPSVRGTREGIEIEVYFFNRPEGHEDDAPLEVSTAYPKDGNYVPPTKKG